MKPPAGATFYRVRARALALLMASACQLVLLLTALPSPASAGYRRAPSIPDTPAGHALSSWLAAFNSGNGSRIDSFDSVHYPWMALDEATALRARTGGYELLSIDSSGTLWITFHAREKSGASQIAGKLVVDSRNPGLIWALSLAPAARDSNPIMLDEAERHRVLENAARLLAELYVFPDVATRMSITLRLAEARGTYRDISDGQIFAWRLNDDLQAIAHDEHLGVHVSPHALSESWPGQASRSDAAARQRLLAGNCGFEEIEHLAPNIGYLKFDEFDDAGTCASTAAAAMSFLANSDALIIDMRDNHGGRGLVQFILSYLFAKPTHFMDTYSRSDHTLHESWTLPHVPGKRFIGKPLFVLTSRRTFSAAEAFCYALKTLDRATLVGEITGGGAHPMEVHRIDEHFSISVPTGQSISPITHTDWEGTGVEPNVKVPAAEAFDEALRRARAILQNRSPSP